MRLLAKEIISALTPFSALKKRQINDLLDISLFKEYEPDQIIYRENDPPDKFYLLLKGRLLALSLQEGKSRGIEMIKRGTPFGLISLFTEDPHSVTVKALEPSVVLEIGKNDFKKFIRKNPHAALEFSRILSQKVKKRAGKPKKIFQCFKLGICAETGCPCASSYIRGLAEILYKETGKKIIVMECSSRDRFVLDDPGEKESPVFSLAKINCSDLSGFICRGDWDRLSVSAVSGKVYDLFTLINELSEEYHYILYLWSAEDELLTGPCLRCAGTVHYLGSDCGSGFVALNKQLKTLPSAGPGKTEKILCGPFSGPRDKISCYASLPLNDDGAYKLVLRRIAREMGNKTVGLVLGSGAAFGLSHIGVLKILHQENIPVDIVSGTSMGALIAVLWGLGYPIPEIEDIAREFGKKILFSSFASFVFPFKGFLKSRNLEKMLSDIFGDRTFYDLKHKVRVCSFDFIKRDLKIIEEGELYKAVAASCAMPGVFEPITYHEQIFLDGGILAPLPVQSVIDYATKVIAVNVTPSREEIVRASKLKKYKKYTILDFIFGSVETMQRELIEDAKKSADVVIHPDLSRLSWVEFTKVEEFIKRGEQATLDHLAEIQKLIRE